MAGRSFESGDEGQEERGVADAIVGGKAEGWSVERWLSLVEPGLRQEAAQLCAKLLRPLLRQAYDAGREARPREPGRLLLVSAPCRGESAIALCESGRIVAEREGRLPEFLAEEGGDGARLELAIDVATGRIANWRPLDEDALAALFDKTK
jgi:hypothetical protein